MSNAYLDSFEAEGFGGAGGEGAAEEGVGLTASAFVGLVYFFVAGLFEDFFDRLDVVFGYDFYQFAVYAFVLVVGSFESYFVAFIVGEYGVSVFRCSFCHVMETACLCHTFGRDVVDEQVSDVYGIDCLLRLLREYGEDGKEECQADR